MIGKPFSKAFAVLSLLLLAGCSTNPATGERQFAALMPPSQEASVGASEHQNVIREFGLYDDAALNAYVNAVGARVTKNTERPDVRYTFYVVDSPVVNAFALPGGYIYVSRGLLALVNSEAELAAVLGHEAGHITARHSAERYSHGVLTSLGASVLSAAVGSQGVSQALGVGANLYMSSYSRGQENQADSLGLRYLSNAGYDTQAMSRFLAALQEDTSLTARTQNKAEASGVSSYFSTHPATAERVSATSAEASKYKPGGEVGRDVYLNKIDGMDYGDSAKQGFVRGQSFLHPGMGFAFDAPDGFMINNQAAAVVATSPTGAVVIFDMAPNSGATSAADFVGRIWMKGEKVAVEETAVNGMPAASAGFAGQVNGKPMTIRIMAIRYGDNYARFQVAIPQNASSALVDDLKRTTYSFRSLSAAERQSLKPWRVRVVTASGSDNAASIAARQPFDSYKEERFRVMNQLRGGNVVAGEKYKIVTE